MNRKILEKLSSHLSKMIRSLLISLVIYGRPLLGPPVRCCYMISCTDFAIFHLKNSPLHTACWLICKRLATCNPIANIIYRISHKI